MGTRGLVYFVIAFLLVGNCRLALSDNDLKSCVVKGGYLKIGNNWGLAFDRDYKVGERSEDLYYTYSNVGLVYKPIEDTLELGFNYRQLYQQSPADPWKPEDCPHINVTVRGRILDFDVSNGTCLEYRSPENQKDILRYANTFAVRFPFLSSVIKLQPYFSHDTYVDVGGDNFAGSGFSSGASLKLSRNLMTDFYYRWQTNRYGNIWQDFRMIGTSLRLTF